MRPARAAIVLGGIALAMLASSVAFADEDDFGGATVIFARGSSLFRADPRGKAETELAKLTTTGDTKPAVRAMRTDSKGAVLIVDVRGKWSWMPLDGSVTTLAPLPCADGPAQLDVAGTWVLCRAIDGGSLIYNLQSGKQTRLQVPIHGARLVGQGTGLRAVWAEAGAIWQAPPEEPTNKTKVAIQAPIRSLLPSPDGARAVGTYIDIVHEGKYMTAADVLMVFALDGNGARRKSVRDGVPVEWSHDSQWVLIQDGARACVVRATGGDYKCWRGYTGASIASDGRWALVLGNRDGTKKQISSDKKKEKKKKKKRKKDDESEPIEPSNEAEGAGSLPAPADDVTVAPPSGPLALYRVKMDGAETASPARIVPVMDGTAVWVPGR
jgi:hypothetical protein